MSVLPFLDISSKSEWENLKSCLLSQIIPTYRNSYDILGSYSIIEVRVNESGIPEKIKGDNIDIASFQVFTRDFLRGRAEIECSWGDISSPQTSSFNGSFATRPMMLGELVTLVAHDKELQSIKVNPLLTLLPGNKGKVHLCEEVLFCPIFDKFTKKYLLTDPSEAKSLLGISPLDQSRFGIEMLFYFLTTRTIPDNHEDRGEFLKNELGKMAFILPRVPMRKGSASIISVLLDLDNEIEESAFIRQYDTFDQFSDILFVNSSLKLLTGQLEEIRYDGMSIDTIFGPVISWQQRNQDRYW